MPIPERVTFRFEMPDYLQYGLGWLLAIPIGALGLYLIRGYVPLDTVIFVGIIALMNIAIGIVQRLIRRRKHATNTKEPARKATKEGKAGPQATWRSNRVGGHGSR